MVIVRDDLLKAKPHPMTPLMCEYKLCADNKSLFNTPPTFSIYLMKLYFDYILERGGIRYFEEQNIKKAKLIYNVIDNSKGFYVNPVEKPYRSRMNIPFIMPKSKEKKNSNNLKRRKIGKQIFGRSKEDRAC